MKYQHRFYLICNLMVGLILIPALAPAQEGSLRVDRDRAFDAVQQGQFEEAAGLLEALADSTEGDSELHYWLGYTHWELKHAEQSIGAYRAAIDSDPAKESLWSLYALENLAEVYGRTDRLQASRASYEAALQREVRTPWRIKIETQLAELALTMGEFVPDDRTVFNERGEVVGGIGPSEMRTNQHFEIARHTQDPVKQERHYRLAIEVDPAMYQSYFNLGLALVAQEQYADAIPWFVQSESVYKQDTDANPLGQDKADAHAFLALCHLELNQLERAQEHAEISLHTDPDYYWGNLFAERIREAREDSGEVAWP